MHSTAMHKQHRTTDIILRESMSQLKNMRAEITPINQAVQYIQPTNYNHNVHSYDDVIKRHIRTVIDTITKHLTFTSIPKTSEEILNQLIESMPTDCDQNLRGHIDKLKDPITHDSDIAYLFATSIALIQFFDRLSILDKNIKKVSDLLKANFYGSVFDNYITNGGCRPGITNRAFIQLLDTIMYLSSDYCLSMMRTALMR